MASERALEVAAAYEEWDPEEKTSEQLAEGLGLSRARMYTLLRQTNTRLKRDEREDQRKERNSSCPRLEDGMAEVALKAILDQLYETRVENDALRERLAELEGVGS